jgi:hypothetical protein
VRSGGDVTGREVFRADSDRNAGGVGTAPEYSAVLAVDVFATVGEVPGALQGTGSGHPACLAVTQSTRIGGPDTFAVSFASSTLGLVVVEFFHGTEASSNLGTAAVSGLEIDIADRTTAVQHSGGTAHVI